MQNQVQVKRLKFEVELDTEQNSDKAQRLLETQRFIQQRQLCNTFNIQVLPALEQALQKWQQADTFSQDEVLFIDKLTLDISDVELLLVSEMHSPKQSSGQSSNLNTANAKLTQNLNTLSDLLYEQLRFSMHALKSANQKSKRQQGAQSLADEGLYYFIHGHMPWYSQYTNSTNMLAALKQNRRCIECLLKGLKQSFYEAKMWKRLSLSPHNDLLLALLNCVDHAKHNSFIADFKAPLGDLPSPRASLSIVNNKSAQLSAQLWITLGLELGCISSSSKRLTLNSNKQSILKSIAHDLFNQLSRDAQVRRTSQKLANALWNIIDMNDYEIGQSESATSSKDSKTNLQNDGTKGVKSLNSKREAERFDNTIVAKGAGVVLLHLFLPSLFDELKLLRDCSSQNALTSKAFIDESAQMKGINTLHYLCFGGSDSGLGSGSGFDGTNEEAFTFFKWLCGWDMDAPLQVYALSESDKAQCDSLLCAAIAHFSVIKNTSIEGFQEAFLARSGYLCLPDALHTKVTPSEVVLRVEEAAIDLLLSQLPWSLSVIKLPWLENAFFVDWAKH
uniref:contractile injection system tape measure protein n=1 Tax=Ningiella ruwaisensis TaxID=2364274 RepID=UPI00109F3823|nr:contractile injection system tape measure protein [Ningiella ruwaisensis]